MNENRQDINQQTEISLFNTAYSTLKRNKMILDS